jgi:chemotaxis protein methyltransferase CheR
MTGKHAAVAQLAALVTESTGNLVPPPRLAFLAEVAQRRTQALGLGTVGEYVRALTAGELPREWQSLVPLVTIKESYFFRAPQQFEAIERQLLPRLLRARAASRRLRIWSAACARGEEPATLAMLLADHPALAGWEWSILATDLDEEALAGARRGLYGERAVAPVPPALLARWFSRRGKLFELAPELRSRIDYRTLNLAQPPFALPADEYDLILLRNVLIYFGRPLQSWVMAHVRQFLSRRGALFLGASETLWQIQDDLEAVDLGACYCYRHRRARPGGVEPEPEPAVTGSASARSAPRPVVAAKAMAAAKATASATSAPASSLPVSASDLTPVAAAPRRRPPAITAPIAPSAASPPKDAAAPRPRSALEILLGAAHQLAANRIEAAGQAVEEALAADPSEPAGHLLDGFLHDLGGRTEEAAASYRAALYLDPSLFQARLLLADSLLRLDQRGRAEHQYREVLAALAAGRERPVAIFDGLPLPDRERALRRCRQALQQT